MHSLENPDEAAVEVALWQMFLADRARGAARPTAAYQECFPGFEEFVAQRLTELTGATGAGDARAESIDAHAASEKTAPERPDSVSLWAAEQPARGVAATPAGRYVLANEVGRGGMGEVLRAWDRQLHRSVAIKRLAGEAADSTRSLGRFLDEAQVTGQLQHPGIVPVHDLGIDDRGRAYFTMSLVRGRSFDQVIELAHRGEGGWSRTRVLTSLLRVCEAVAYAHSHGVVHRDLKPGNLMVGCFGETYVMDWGVAQIPGRSDSGFDASETAAAKLTRTVAGEVLGTPAYMAPEQAEGRIDDVGPASDVYALGAVLYHLLAGHAPFADENGDAERRTLDRVRSGPPTPVHVAARDAAPELVAICDRAMARRPEARYASVEELAEDLRSYLEVRVVRAYRTGAVAELRKWIARNRGLAIACAAAVLALVLGLASSLRFGAQAERAAAESERAAAHAEANFRLAFEAVDRLLSQVGTGKLASVPQAQAARREILGDAVAILREFLSSRAGDPRVRAELGRAWIRLGKIHLLLGEEDDAVAAYDAGLAVLVELAEEAPERVDVLGYLVEARSARAAWVGSRGNTAEARAEFESMAAIVRSMIVNEPGEAKHRDRLALVLRNLATALSKDGEWGRANELRREGLAILADLRDADPDSHRHLWRLMQEHGEFGYALFLQGEIPAADAEFTNGLRALDELLAVAPDDREFREDAAEFLGHLSVYQMQIDRHVRALDTLRRCAAIHRRLTAEFPDVPAYHGRLGANVSNIGQTLARLGWIEAGRERLEEAIRHERRAVDMAPHEPLWARYLRNQYGHVIRFLRELGRDAEAERWAAELERLQAAGKAAR